MMRRCAAIVMERRTTIAPLTWTLRAELAFLVVSTGLLLVAGLADWNVLEGLVVEFDDGEDELPFPDVEEDPSRTVLVLSLMVNVGEV